MNVQTEPRKTIPERPVRLLPDVRDRAFLPAALEIIETPASPARLALLMAICAFAAIGLLWSWVGRLDIYATARGKVEPAGHSKVVQPLELGKVTSVNVVDGQTVNAGQILIQLDVAEAQAEIGADNQAIVAARAEALRRRAAVNAVGTTAPFTPPAIAWPGDIPELIRQREEAVLAGDLRELSATLESIQAQKREREALVQQLNASIQAEKLLQETLDERVVLKQALVDKSVGTKTGLLDAVQVVRQAQAQLAGDIGKRDQAIVAVASLTADRQKAIETFLSDNLRKEADSLRRVDEKSADKGKAEVRLDRLTLKAPVDGIVQALSVTTVGQVVTPGQELMRIVPAGTPVEIQAYIPNEDIGFISIGQEAFVKVDAFPFTRYGTIEAKVIAIAHDAIAAETANRAFADPTQKSDANRTISPTAKPMSDLVFETRLEPSAPFLTVNGRKENLTPGMTVTVEVKVGSRRVLEYLFSPLLEIGSKAFREK